MTSAARNLLVVGLRNAHAMERQAEELMERQIERTNDYPDMQMRLREHLAETRRQKTRVEDCLRDLSESTSTFKDIALSMLGNMAALAHVPARDEILKNTFANNAFENYEIAAYKSLLALCEPAGVKFASRLQESLREEEAMAAWVDAHVAQVTLDYLSRQERQAA